MAELKIDGERLRLREGSWLVPGLAALALLASGVLASSPIWSAVPAWQAGLGAGLLGTVAMLGVMVPGRRILTIDRATGRFTFEVIGLVKRVRNEHAIEEVVAVRILLAPRAASVLLLLRDQRGVPVSKDRRRRPGATVPPAEVSALAGHLAGFLGLEVEL